MIQENNETQLEKIKIKLTEKQKEAFQYMKKGHSVFLTGPGGSGKSFLLKYFIEWFKKEIENDKNQIFVTSTTGLSALLIDGMTIHRYSGIGTGKSEVDELFKKIYKIPHIRKRWLSTAVLIIDEISMMDAGLFDKLEILAKKIRKNNNIFGGIQIILSGDFLQLPPVGSTNFCFESFCWDDVVSRTFYFDKILRQSDSGLQDILNNIRVGIVNEEVRSVLDSCIDRDLTNEAGIVPTLLFSKKDMVSKYNEDELNKLLKNGNESHIYNAAYEYSKNIQIDQHSFFRDLINNSFQIGDCLCLCIDAQVMLTVNMPEFGLANGSRGIVIKFSGVNFNPVVRFLNGIVLEIQRKEYLLEENKSSCKKIQIPLIHSWAITIHKAQGMSLEYVKTDIGNSIFEYGQAYVVLSRIKDINGLSLINIDYSKIFAHPKILEYYKRLKG